MTILNRTLHGILMALCLSSGLPALADDGAAEVEGDATVGGQKVLENPQNSAKFYEFRDVPSGFVAESVRLQWTPKPYFFFDIDAHDITQDDTRGAIQFGRTDLWKGSITWLDNPRRWGDGTQSLFSDKGGATFTLEDTLQAAVQAAPASVDTSPMDGEWDAGTKGALIKDAIAQGSQDVFLGYQRRTLGLGFTATPSHSWTVDASASRERRSGTNPQPLGMYFALSPSEVAAPVDFNTDWESVRAEYARRNWNVGMQLAASQFETSYKSLTWDDQLFLNDTAVNATAAGPGRMRLTLGTDNEMKQAVVYGGVSLPGRTRIDATFSSSETKQDDQFLPMTTNTVLQPLLSPLPANNLAGEHRYTLAQVRVSSRPLPWFRWSAWGRQWEMENRSSALEFPEYVSTDYQIPLCSNANACGATTNRLARANLLYGFEKDNYGALAGFKPVRWLDASISYELQQAKREHSAVEESDEDIYKLTLDFDVTDRVNIKTTARRMERRADDYHAEYFEESFPIGEAIVAPLNEGSRRFTWTDRDRDDYSVMLEVTPLAQLSVYAEWTYAKDTYMDPVTGKKIGESFDVSEDRNFDGTPEDYTLLLAGRTFDKNITYTLGIAGSPTDRCHVYGDYTWEEFKYRLATRYRAPVSNVGSDDPLDDWGSDAIDRYTTVSVGFDADLDKNAAWKIAANASRSQGKGNISTDFVPGGNASGDTTLTNFPELKTTLTIATLDLTHRVRKNFDYTLRYWYERWHERNWASDRMRQYMGDPGNDPGSVTSIYLGMDFDNYEYSIVSLLMRYHF